MRIAVVGFVPERLRDAMSIRNRTGKDLADAIGIKDNTISRYLTGTTKPDPQIFLRLAKELNVDESYLIRPLPPQEGSALFYRSLAAATKRARQKAEVRNRWLRESWAYLNEYVKFPDSTFPDLGLSNDPTEISNEDIERAAEELRRLWALGIGPIADMIALVETHGGIVARTSLDSPKLDAFSQWGNPENRPFIILNADKRAAVRSRWDCAHELGHMVLHRRVDRAYLWRSEIFKHAEAQAHRFAGAFLLPAQSFGRNIYVPTWSALVAQKRIWHVSIAGMLKRMQDLHLINTETATRVWQSYSRSGMRRGEPLDNELQPERPDALRRSCEIVMRSKGVSREQLLQILPFDEYELQGLLGMPIGFSKPLTPSLRVSEPSETSTSEDARVLPFRRSAN